MDEKLNAMVGPHSPLPLPRMRNENQLEVDPVGIDAIIDAVVGLNPIAIDIAGIRLLGTKAAVKVNFLNTGRSKGLDGCAEPLQQPSTTRREPEALCSRPTLLDNHPAATHRYSGQKPESIFLHSVRDKDVCQHLCCLRSSSPKMRCFSQGTRFWLQAQQGFQRPRTGLGFRLRAKPPPLPSTGTDT
jgi:hypothetical protein